MKITALVFTAILGLAIAADDGDKKDHKKGIQKHRLTSDQRQCHRMSKLNHIMKISNNQTAMDRIQAKHPERVQKIKDDAAKAGPELSSMQQNNTLVQYCGSYNAHQKLIKQCRTLKMGDRLSNKLKNNTAIEESARRKNKSTDEIKTRWQKEIDHVNRLKSNSTLVDQCNKMKSQKGDKKGDKKGGDKKADKKPENKNEKGKGPEKQQSAAAHVQVAGTGAFALGLSLLMASLML